MPECQYGVGSLASRRTFFCIPSLYVLSDWAGCMMYVLTQHELRPNSSEGRVCFPASQGKHTARPNYGQIRADRLISRTPIWRCLEQHMQAWKMGCYPSTSEVIQTKVFQILQTIRDAAFPHEQCIKSAKSLAGKHAANNFKPCLPPE